VQRFRAAAERLGYIVISSYNTLSDGPAQPNYAAMTAMLADVQRSLPVDSRRLYLAGFSGTARFAWQVSTQLGGAIAGIIGAGASVPGGPVVDASEHREVGAGAVRDDRDARPELRGGSCVRRRTWTRSAHRTTSSDSTAGTSGPPWSSRRERSSGSSFRRCGATCARATRAGSIRSTARGCRVSPAWTRRATRPAAARAYTQLRADFGGLTQLEAVSAALTRLEGDPRIRRTEAAEAAAAERDRAWVTAMLAFSADLERASSPPSVDDARKRLDLDRMQREASRTDDSTSAMAARRALERTFTHMSFYAPRQFSTRVAGPMRHSRCGSRGSSSPGTAGHASGTHERWHSWATRRMRSRRWSVRRQAGR
jgi:hypothetical protein